jgi:hypothetical protein
VIGGGSRGSRGGVHVGIINFFFFPLSSRDLRGPKIGKVEGSGRLFNSSSLSTSGRSIPFVSIMGDSSCNKKKPPPKNHTAMI